MRVVKSPREISRILDRLKRGGRKIGLVPTMGCLHEGHFSLIRRAKKENDKVVVSIFVNPKQFAPKEDYKKYPRDLRRDAVLARRAGCDIIFCPGQADMYPDGYAAYVAVRNLSSRMCGISRPTHFEGVSTVCAKLFNIIRPDTAYFGQKDFQQALIIKRMVEDLNMGFKVKVLPIIRQKSGLAMSSRNKYLKPHEKKNAAVIFQSLMKAKGLIKAGARDASKIKAVMRRMILGRPGIRIDYIAIADPCTLVEKKRIDSNVLIALAVWVGRTRLIDNILVDV